ncbi:MAG: ATPase domain-containing protein [Dehalococcoidales bacterium]|nr:ATPase domain-containing protein [Dehalococcoidales bacterium]
MAEPKVKREVICTGVAEVDERLGGGIPVGSLCLIEGHSDSGKSVLCQHLTYGTLSNAESSVAYYTTENSIRSLVTQMDSLSMYTMDHFLADHFRIYPLIFRNNTHDGKKPFMVLTHHFSKLPKQFKLVIIDSITILVAHSNPVSIIDFFSQCKQLCDDGRSIIVVSHSYAFEEDMLARTRSLCDARFRLRLEQIGDRMVKLMEVLKVRGADRPTGDVVSFDIEPKVGMRIIPLAKARV